jgi:hypothetical protein
MRHALTVDEDIAAIREGRKNFVTLPYGPETPVAVDDVLELSSLDPASQAGQVTVKVTYVTSVDNHCALSPQALSPNACIASITLVP